MTPADRLIVVSNRLPITIETTEHGARLQRSAGGLVSALLPIVRDTGGCWVGWAGTDYDPCAKELIRHSCSAHGYMFEPIFLTAAERDHFYRGFSNEIIWPLFHGLPSQRQFSSEYWNGYCKANEKFAEAVARVSQKESFVWIHDYHLMLLGRAVRARGMHQRTGYFHHVPFPPPDVFDMLPWRNALLRALLEFDLVGFQTAQDLSNYMSSIGRHLPAVHAWKADEDFIVRAGDHWAKAGVYPISIDYREYAAEASKASVVAAAKAIREELRTPMILGVDRLDYTKGIPERLTAFQKLLECNPELRGQVSMVQIVVPSREEISEYRQLRRRIETLVSQINERYATPAWKAVHYLYNSFSRPELISFYRAADVALVTPLKDGMNLVAKEFCASRVDNRGVLVLSQFAGAATELRFGALVVNPRDTDRVASVLVRALRMADAEQHLRMEAMRLQVSAHDVFHWSRSFIKQCLASDVILPQAAGSESEAIRVEKF